MAFCAHGDHATELFISPLNNLHLSYLRAKNKEYARVEVGVASGVYLVASG